MIRKTLCMLALVTVAGCSNMDHSSASGTNSSDPNATKMSNTEPTSEQLAAYAGGHLFPATQPARDDLRAAAIISADRSTLKVYNFSKEPIKEANVWVNGAFVGRINGIAPLSSVVIKTKDLYNSLGQNFVSTASTATRIQIQADGELSNVLGPATE